VETERKLSAVMLTDIAGYSALMERDESRTFRRLQALRETVFAPKVQEYGGRIVKTTGDGFLAIFPSATACLGCGINIQRANYTQEANKDEAERFHLRMGINVGDIIVDGDDVSGNGVNIAARLEPLAPLDGICISGAVRDQVREDLGVVIEDIGDQRVKNITHPIRAYRINLAYAPDAKLGAGPRTRNRSGPARLGFLVPYRIPMAVIGAGIAAAGLVLLMRSLVMERGAAPQLAASIDAGGDPKPSTEPDPRLARFDGIWSGVLDCVATPDLPGWRFEFQAIVKNGHFFSKRGRESGAGSQTYQGPIDVDGSAVISQVGLSGDPATDAFHRPMGTPIHTTYLGLFDDHHATLTRSDRASCTIKLDKRAT
jgi:class 3 adenylate cyclase